MNTRNRISRAAQRVNHAPGPAQAQDAPSVPIAGELVSVEDLPRGTGDLYRLAGDYDLVAPLLHIAITWQHVKDGRVPMGDLHRAIIRYKLECLRRGHELPTYEHEPGEFEAILARLERIAANQPPRLYTDLSDEDLQRTLDAQ